MYKVIPVFKSIITNLNTYLVPFIAVNYKLSKALEDYITINIRATRKKAAIYLDKLLKVPVYYAAIVLYL